MSQFYPKTILLSLVLALILSFPSTAQTPGDEEAKALYRSAHYQIGWYGHFEQALPLFLQAANEHQGSIWAVRSLFSLADFTEEAQRPAIYNRIIAEYPDSVWETSAKLYLLELQAKNDGQAFLDTASELAVELGGPALSDILESQDHKILAEQIQELSPLRQTQLSNVYSNLWPVLAQKHGGGLGRRADGLPLAIFLRSVICPLVESEDTHLWEIAYSSGTDYPAIGNGLANPSVTISKPHENEATDRLPSILVSISVGPITFRQLDLNATDVLLDGIDIKPHCLVQGSYNATALPDEPFEILNLEYTPGVPLSSGSHELRIRAVTDSNREGQTAETELVRNFTVVIAPTGPLSVGTNADSTLTQKSPHTNEGGNSVLTLEKIQGKAARTAVGFDLANVNLSGLSKATLRLTVDPNQHVDGWGNGEVISAVPLTTQWAEGNGRSFGLSGSNQVSGSGSGVTWFSAVDTDISNDYANSAFPWNGGSTAQGTAPGVTITNHYSGTVDFDVTGDLLNGQGQNGWLVFKNQENKGSKVSFYSREGATAAGNSELAPTLILEYGSPSAQAPTLSPALQSLVAGFGFGGSGLRADFGPVGSELPGFRDQLQKSDKAAWLGETFVTTAASSVPAGREVARMAYRAWLYHSVV